MTVKINLFVFGAIMVMVTVTAYNNLDKDEMDELDKDYFAEFDNYDADDLNCQVCESIVDEVGYSVERVNPNVKIETDFRLDSAGNLNRDRVVTYARSETFLTEKLETLCDRYGAQGIYAKGKHLRTGRSELVRLMFPNKTANPKAYEVKIDPQHNRYREMDLKHQCLTILEQNDELIIQMVKDQVDTSTQKTMLCEEVCRQFRK